MREAGIDVRFLSLSASLLGRFPVSCLDRKQREIFPIRAHIAPEAPFSIRENTVYDYVMIMLITVVP